MRHSRAPLGFATAILSLSVLLAACESDLSQPQAPAGASVRAPSQLMSEGGGWDELAPVDDGSGGGGYEGGGGSPAPTEPIPGQPLGFFPHVPIWEGGVYQAQSYRCNQDLHVRVAFSNDVVRGTYLYPTGVVVPSSKANFHIYNQNFQLVKTHLTHYSHDNCVIQHEDEAMSTADLAPGIYYVYASYWYLTDTSLIPYRTGYPSEAMNRYVTTLRIR